MRRFLKSFSLFGVLFWMSSMTVFANDAVSDILNNTRYQGAINRISRVTEWFDDKMVMVISFCSFALISFSILQNVVAGTCLAYPKFWSKVHQAHQQKSFGAALMGLAGGLKGIVPGHQGGAPGLNTTGGGSSMILSFVPDLMALTDLEDQEVSAKVYFSKSLPKLFLCVCIGIFIYNGYYRDSASLVGGMGSEIVERALGSVSPESFVNKITNTTGKPSSIYEAATDRKGQNAAKLADELYTSIVGNVDGGAVRLTAAEKTSIMRQAEVSAAQILENHPQWFDYTKNLEYSLTVKSRFITRSATVNYTQYGISDSTSWSGTTTGDFSGTVFVPATDFNGVDDFAVENSDFGGVILAISATAKDWENQTEGTFVQPAGDAASADGKTYTLSIKSGDIAQGIGASLNGSKHIILGDGKTVNDIGKWIEDYIRSVPGLENYTITSGSLPSGANGGTFSTDASYKIGINFNLPNNGTNTEINCFVVVKIIFSDSATTKWENDTNPIAGSKKALAAAAAGGTTGGTEGTTE